MNEGALIRRIKAIRIAHASAGLGTEGHTPGAIGSELAQIGAKTQLSHARMPTDPPITPKAERILSQCCADASLVQYELTIRADDAVTKSMSTARSRKTSVTSNGCVDLRAK